MRRGYSLTELIIVVGLVLIAIPAVALGVKVFLKLWELCS